MGMERKNKEKQDNMLALLTEIEANASRKSHLLESVARENEQNIQKLKQMQQQLDDLNAEMERTKNENIAAQQTMKRTNDKLRKALQKMKRSQQRNKEEMNAKRKFMESEFNQWRKDRDTLSTNNELFKQEMSKLQTENDELCNQIEQMDEKILILKQMMERQLEDLNAEM